MAYTPKTVIEYYENLRNYLILKSSRLTNFERGSRVRTLLESLSLELARSDSETLRGFIHAIREGMYGIFGFERKEGAKSTGYITITRSDLTPTGNITFPVFTIDLYGLQFETTQENILGDGASSMVVEARALALGLDGNIQAYSIDTDNGDGTIIPPDGFTIQYGRIYNNVDFQNGTDEESDSDREIRFQEFINSLGKATEQGIKAEVLKHPDVQDVTVTSNINPYTGLPETGWVSVYISDGTANPPQLLLDEILKIVEGDENDIENYPGIAAAGVQVYVGTMEVQEIDITYSLEVKSSSSLTALEAEDLATQGAYKYVNFLPMGEDVLIETLKAYILTSSEDFYKVIISLPLSDVSVPANKAARIRTISCTGVSFVTPI